MMVAQIDKLDEMVHYEGEQSPLRITFWLAVDPWANIESHFGEKLKSIVTLNNFKLEKNAKMTNGASHLKSL